MKLCNKQKRTSNEQKITSNERKVTSSEQKVTTIEQRVKSFTSNQMKANHGKCQVRLSTPEETDIQVSGPGFLEPLLKALNVKSY